MKKLPFKLFGLPAAVAISASYLLLGLAWIVLSDKVLVALVSDPELQNVFQMCKGWFYVCFTTLLLYVSLKRVNRHINRAHAKWGESEERLRLIFDHAGDGIALLTGDLVIVDCNPGFCRIYGVDSKADLVGKSVMDFTPERQRDGRLSSEAGMEISLRLNHDEPVQFFWRHRKVSGEMVDVEVSCRKLRIEGAEFEQAIVRDVTERFFREEEERREDMLNRLLLELYGKTQTLTDKELCDFVLNHAVALTGSGIGFLHLVSEDSESIQLAAWNGVAMEWCSTLSAGHSPLAEAGNWADCVRLKRAVIYNDYSGSPNQKGLPEGHAPLQRFLGVPVLDGSGARLVLGLGDKASEYDGHDVLQVQLVANELHKILSHRRLVEALRKSEANLSEAQRIARIGSWRLDLASNRLEWSDEVYRIFGLDPDSLEPSFEGFLNVVHPDDRELVQRAYNDSLKNKTPYEIEHRLLMKDGTVKFVTERCETHYAKEDTPVCSIGTVQDVTDCKKAEEAAARQRERLKFIFDSLPIGISLNRMHLDGRESRLINDAHLRIAGIRRDQDEPKIWESICHPADYDRQLMFMRQIEEGEIDHFTLDKRYIHPDGRIVWVLFSKQRRKLTGSGFEDLCTVVDITERKQAEGLLFKREREFRALVENSQYIIARYDRDCQRIYVNPAYLEMARIPRDELIDTAPEYRSPLSPSDAGVLQELLRRVLDTAVPESVELPVTKGADSQRWYHIHVVPEYDRDGEVESALLTAHDITEGKRATEKLLEATRQLQYIVNNTHDVIFQIDLEGNYIYGNAAAEDMTGYPLPELLQMNMMQLIAPECQRMVAERLRQRIDGDLGDHMFDFEIVHKDGHRVWLELETRGVFSEEGKLAAVQGVARDITERKRMEDALESRIVALTRPLDQVEDLVFEDLFDIEEIQRIQDQFAAATSVASGIIRPDGSFITKPINFTRLCRDVVRKTEAGCANCRKSDIILGRHHPGGPVVQPCLSGGLWDAGVSIVVGGTHVASWLIGQVRDETQTDENMRAYARQIGVDEEEFMEAFREVPQMSRERFGQISDALHTLVNQLSATAYMNMQQARFIADEKKRTAELLRLSTAIDQAAETVVITNAEGIIEYVNPSFHARSGYTREEALGQTPRMLKSGMHDDAFYKSLWERISSGAEWKGLIQNKRKDGSIYTEEVVISPVHDAKGKIVNYVAVKRDITKEISLEEQFRQAQKMEAVGRLASGVAHDFNNILQTILGFCGVLLMETGGQDAIQQDVREIQGAAKRAGDLTRQLLTFSRKQPVMQTRLDLNLVVADETNMLCRLLGENIRLIFDPSENLKAVRADRSQMEQVVMNLVVNARDAMPDGGRIDIRTGNISFADDGKDSVPKPRVGEFVYLSVSDTGTGIAKEVMEHLFEPFFTTKPVGQGTGLGLAVIYGIVDQHGGWVDVESTPGDGSLFKVYLPVSDGEAKPDDLEVDGTIQAMEGSGGRKRVLLVEDDPQVRELATLILHEAGYVVDDAENASQAKEVFGQNGGRFDLLLIDAVLPDQPGVLLADVLVEKKKGLSVIVFSGYSDERVQLDAIEKKGYSFLRKPFSTEVLLNMVQSVLGRACSGARGK